LLGLRENGNEDNFRFAFDIVNDPITTAFSFLGIRVFGSNLENLEMYLGHLIAGLVPARQLIEDRL